MSGIAEELAPEIEAQAQQLAKLREEVAKVIVGQAYMVDRLLMALIADGHILIEGIPGLAKTTAVKAVADALHTGFARVQFTPDLLPADLIGTEIYRPQHLDFMVKTRLFTSQIVMQIILGTLVPIALLAFAQVWKVSERVRQWIYLSAGLLTLVGIFAMRWNVVIGGQLFSKSFLGYTTYKMEFATREGLLPAILLMILPFIILWVLVRVLPPWTGPKDHLANV